MIIKDKNISNDLKDLEILTEALKTIKTYKHMIDSGYTILSGWSCGKDFITDIIKGLSEDSKYILDCYRSDINNEKIETIIFSEPMQKDNINISNFICCPNNAKIDFQWVNEDYKLFLDMMQQSFCTTCQTITWHGNSIDRSGNDSYMADKFGDKLKSKGYVTRAIIKYIEKR